jgi:ankyrin repeat protein
MVAMLLEEGAQANSMDRYGRTPLMMACQGCHVGVARLLLEQGGEGLEVRDDEESTALHHAAEGGHEQIIRFLLLAGANSTPKNKYGTTPRDLAMATGDPQCTRVFDVSIQDIYIYIYILFVSIIIMYLSIYLYPWYGDCVHSALPKTPR